MQNIGDFQLFCQYKDYFMTFMKTMMNQFPIAKMQSINVNNINKNLFKLPVRSKNENSPNLYKPQQRNKQNNFYPSRRKINFPSKSHHFNSQQSYVYDRKNLNQNNQPYQNNQNYQRTEDYAQGYLQDQQLQIVNEISYNRIRYRNEGQSIGSNQVYQERGIQHYDQYQEDRNQNLQQVNCEINVDLQQDQDYSYEQDVQEVIPQQQSHKQNKQTNSKENLRKKIQQKIRQTKLKKEYEQSNYFDPSYDPSPRQDAISIKSHKESKPSNKKLIKKQYKQTNQYLQQKLETQDFQNYSTGSHSDLKSQKKQFKRPYKRRQRKVLYMVQGEEKQYMKRYFSSDQFIAMRENFRRMELGELNQKGQKISLKDMCIWHRCGRSTMHKFYHAWLQDPLMSALITKHLKKQTLKPKMLKYGVTNKISQRLQIFHQIIRCNPFLNRQQIVAQIQQKLGVALQQNSIRRLIQVGEYKKVKVMFDFKKRNLPQIIEQRYKFCKHYQQFQQQRDIYFINLEEIKLHRFFDRECAWAKEGEQVNLQSQQFKRMCVTIFIIIGNTGHLDFDYKIGPYTQKQFIQVMQKFFENFKQASREKVIVVQPDQKSLQSNRIKIIQQLCQQYDAQLQLLPLYSPQLNPLNSILKDMKIKLRYLPHKNQEMIYFNLVQIMKKISKKHITKAYQDIKRNIQEGINKQMF